LSKPGIAATDVGAGDTQALRQAVPKITDVLGQLLDRVKTGYLALPPGDEKPASVHIGWLRRMPCPWAKTPQPA
jgi:hypothetical protein